MRDEYGSCYPAHGIGTIAKWMGINEGDRMEYCTCMQNDPKGVHHWIVERHGTESDLAKIDFQRGDFITTLIHTVKGKVIRVDEGGSSTRPYTRYYLLSGLKGTYDSRWGLYLQGISKTSYEGWHRWDSLSDYYNKWQHSYWRKEGEKARAAGGHAGIDYLCVRDFVDMVRYDREPWIDVYDCASWASLYHCSHLSLERKSQPVEMPDFTGGRWKDPDWRKDNYVPT